MNSEIIAHKFVESINRHDIIAIGNLMSEDHIFIDSMGTVAEGRDSMKQGWTSYFRMVPDYLIDVEEVFVTNDTVILIGKASGTYTSDGRIKPGNHWKIPAAWKAVILKGKIKVWQVFADNEPVREIMKREAASKR